LQRRHFPRISIIANPQNPRSAVAEQRPVSERPITILVAEDEDTLRQLTIRLLGDAGYRTLEARDGGEALHLAHLACSHLSLVVADVVMPGMDGWELGRRLAIDCPAVPVLYMSAYPPADIFHRGAPGRSAVPFLEKPFEPAVFLATVQELLERAPIPSS
jgi:CheY-like chemotaxis protein